MCLAEFVVLGSPSPPSPPPSRPSLPPFLIPYLSLPFRRTACPFLTYLLSQLDSSLSLSRHVRVRVFGYAKCSRASQVECLMALFCLNMDLDTTAERCLRICIHSPAAPAPARLLLRARARDGKREREREDRVFHIELRQKNSVCFSPDEM